MNGKKEYIEMLKEYIEKLDNHYYKSDDIAYGDGAHDVLIEIIVFIKDNE